MLWKEHVTNGGGGGQQFLDTFKTIPDAFYMICSWI